jgi:outer membrane protein W
MRAMLLVLIIVLVLSSVGIAQDSRIQLSIFGGHYYHLEYGSIDDYMPGVNDFPVMPAHSTLSYGASLAYYFSSHIGIEYEARLTSSSQVTLLDPSDNDEFSVKNPKHFSFTLNLVYQILGGNVRPYLLLGGGVDRIMAEEEEFTTEQGYVITLEMPPEDALLDPILNAGAGIHLFLSKRLGIRMDFRYVNIFSKPNNVRTISGYIGASLRF